MANPNQDEHPNGFVGNQYENTNRNRDEEIVQVVYQSDQHGALVGVESTSLLGASNQAGDFADGQPADGGNYEYMQQASAGESQVAGGVQPMEPANQAMIGGGYQEQMSRSGSALPSVAEEPPKLSETRSEFDPTGGHPVGGDVFESGFAVESSELAHGAELTNQYQPDLSGAEQHTQAPIYSTIRKTNQDYDHKQEPVGGEDQVSAIDENTSVNLQDGEPPLADDDIGHILGRHRPGAVEKGSFRNNFRKKLGLSVSSNENDLTAYRQKLLESSSTSLQDATASINNNNNISNNLIERSSDVAPASSSQHLHASLPSKFKRTHSVSFNVNSSRSSRHSVDIRNLPSYLTHKRRTSIVDVARGAMSSLMSSLSSTQDKSGGDGDSSSRRRDSGPQANEEEPIFEEPIAPTLSLGQRVAMVRNVGTEFGTVGWIGQFPEVDDDWIVGVIFDNMIGDCDGAYNGARYFYARPNYAMFVPLSCLTKTDNYIGRPETGTMLSRMSLSLKPGQLISIQRSSIRLQHCFLNAPHQRVGHDVRAVSNRLHCQCHNCGPCAHLTKQGRINALPHFGAHHLPHKKRNSLAHAAVEMLAHHHHHFHEEEEEHDEKDYEFGDNAAHACNFVRYSCCQQNGVQGHEFSQDCEMVRPELLDNLIHAPKAPHRRHTKPGRTARARRQNQQQARSCLPSGQTGGTQAIEAPNQQQLEAPYQKRALELEPPDNMKAAVTGLDEGLGGGPQQFGEHVVKYDEHQEKKLVEEEDDDDDDKSNRSSYLSSRRSGDDSISDSASQHSADSASLERPTREPYNYYQYDTSGFRPMSGVYNTINSQISYMDQQRYVFQRDSAALVHSPPLNSNYSDDFWDGDESSGFSRNTGDNWGVSQGFKRILHCLGCFRRSVQGRHHGNRRRRRPHRRKLSFRDRVLEYRRRQSTFVPSTLAKPHEDFASHGIMLPHPAGSNFDRLHRNGAPFQAAYQNHGDEANSDYSSCSRSSCSSSRSNSPPSNAPNGFQLNATLPMQLQEQQQVPFDRQVGVLAFEHDQLNPGNNQLKSGNQIPDRTQAETEPSYQPQLNYGDFTFGDGYKETYEKQTTLSGDSALSNSNHANTYKSNCSSDTLKHLVDQSISDQVELPQPIDGIISPMSSSCNTNRDEHENRDSPNNGQNDISSLTASVADEQNESEEQEIARRALESFTLEADDAEQERS